MSPETLNYVLAVGTVALQGVTLVLVGAYVARRRFGAYSIFNAQASGNIPPSASPAPKIVPDMSGMIARPVI